MREVTYPVARKCMGRQLVLLLALMAMPLAGTVSSARAADVVIETNRGFIGVALEAERAPKTVANFLAYVAADGYKDALFHRVIPGFMVQTGGYRRDLTLLPESDELRNEADNGLTNRRGTLAMARIDAIDSATRQFFINVADNQHLDHKQSSCTRLQEEERAEIAERGLVKPRTCESFGYAVFGRVVSGMDVVDDIAEQDTYIRNDFLDFPIEPIVIKQIIINPRSRIGDAASRE